MPDRCNCKHRNLWEFISKFSFAGLSSWNIWSPSSLSQIYATAQSVRVFHQRCLILQFWCVVPGLEELSNPSLNTRVYYLTHISSHSGWYCFFPRLSSAQLSRWLAVICSSWMSCTKSEEKGRMDTHMETPISFRIMSPGNTVKRSTVPWRAARCHPFQKVILRLRYIPSI